MRRLLWSIVYLAYLGWHILLGSLTVAKSAWLSRTGLAKPAIVEFPLRCRSDLEILLMASSITITPGTLVLGVAAATPEGEPPTLFVHSLYDNNRDRIVAGLTEMEHKLIRGLRGKAVAQ